MHSEAKKKNSRNDINTHQFRRDCGHLIRNLFAAALVATSLSPLAQSPVSAQQPSAAKPNILVIFGDDIGQSNISAYTDGLVGYKTPNIDRIAKEGMRFTDYYAENSCTAGRSTFITGQVCLRTGLCKVGIPGAAVGLQDRDVTIAQALKPLGYATGQFGKNHLGDRDEFLPTAHGFDEFFGNLYHLNAEEEPERPYYPKNDAAFVKSSSPRGVLRSFADGRIQDTGPLNRKRMETIDDETTNAAVDFMQRQVKADKPFFVWMNTTRMHVFTHVRPSMQGQSGMPGNEYADGMIEHDGHVGLLLKALDDLGIANDTIVVYSTDNGPHMNTWPDGAMTWFRSEKNTNWEGAFRVPCLVRWPGHIKPGTVTCELMSHNDWIPTLCSIAGEPDIVGKCEKGYEANGRTYKVHLDGYDQSKFLTSVEGTVGKNNGVKSARNRFFYTEDDGLLVALRYGDYKYVFSEQRKEGTMGVWAEPFTTLRMQKVFNLMQDPFERADITSNTFWDWQINHVGPVYGVMDEVFKFVASFDEFPPRSFPPSFNPANLMEEKLREIKAGRKLRAAFPMLNQPAEGQKP